MGEVLKEEKDWMYILRVPPEIADRVRDVTEQKSEERMEVRFLGRIFVDKTLCTNEYKMKDMLSFLWETILRDMPL